MARIELPASLKNNSGKQLRFVVMRSTITSRGQTVIPAPIRERLAIGPSDRLEWLVEEDGSIRVIPVAASPVKAFRGRGAVGGSVQRLIADRKADASGEL